MPHHPFYYSGHARNWKPLLDAIHFRMKSLITLICEHEHYNSCSCCYVSNSIIHINKIIQSPWTINHYKNVWITFICCVQLHCIDRTHQNLAVSPWRVTTQWIIHVTSVDTLILGLGKHCTKPFIFSSVLKLRKIVYYLWCKKGKRAWMQCILEFN